MCFPNFVQFGTLVSANEVGVFKILFDVYVNN